MAENYNAEVKLQSLLHPFHNAIMQQLLPYFSSHYPFLYLYFKRKIP